ncbi:DUF2309 domain-containing protein [Botrimarina hoheduenensis]|nr:DUF2309 domain-containing protein [Botrimarina hoheduenensis]
MPTTDLVDAHESATQVATSGGTSQLAAEACRAVAATIAPVWPLADYVAVNPYLGLTAKSFVEAREYLREFSDCELLMPVEYYRQRFQEKQFSLDEVESAIHELATNGVAGADILTRALLEQVLIGPALDQGSTDGPKAEAPTRIRSISADYDLHAGTDWTAKINEEIGKHCAAHYDRGQAIWRSPWQDLPLYAAWRSAMRYDRRLQVLGLGGVGPLAESLPSEPEAAIAQLLLASGLPHPTWQAYLLSLAYELPGWSAWTQYQAAWLEGGEARVGDAQGDDLLGLLAIRLAYDAALAKQHAYTMDVSAAYATPSPDTDTDGLAHETTNEVLVRHVLLRANELGYRNRILAQLSASVRATERADQAELSTESAPTGTPKLAQMAFCIDVRSERIRRHLEAANSPIETIGFAGFFGMPFAYQRLGEAASTNQLPVLVAPQFKVEEKVRAASAVQQGVMVDQRDFVRTLRKGWKRFQTAATSAFAFVEATGMLFGLKLLKRVFLSGLGSFESRGDGVPAAQQSRLGPDLEALPSHGLTITRQADLAASLLAGMGLCHDFARLVVFCGHGSQTENNPLEAGLDCGACGGHSGEPNARLAAQLLNRSEVRAELLTRGIELPPHVHFLAGLHNTTTDEIRFFDGDLVPATHLADVEELRLAVATAASRTRLERLPLLSAAKASDVFRRSLDWSEVRPEWGLTGNATFIVAPRSLTAPIDLAGRSFLHSYDHNTDPDGKVLEAILTAPMVVGSWINLQYYASTVDPQHFGSGSKTIHNVVGRFGAFSGNCGDLMTGLPWESIHDGVRYQHDPVRLLSVVAAPRERIAEILSRHRNVEQLALNGWIHLVALDGGKFYELSAGRSWQEVELS